MKNFTVKLLFSLVASLFISTLVFNPARGAPIVTKTSFDKIERTHISAITSLVIVSDSQTANDQLRQRVNLSLSYTYTKITTARLSSATLPKAIIMPRGKISYAELNIDKNYISENRKLNQVLFDPGKVNWQSSTI